MATDFYADLYAAEGDDFTSESIAVVAYNRPSKTLILRFNGGDMAGYAYEGVEESTYNMLVGAVSLNRFWREHILGSYTSTKHDFVHITVTDDDLDYEDDDEGFVVGPLAGLGAGTLMTNPHTKTRYSVRWNSNDIAAGPFEPTFEAASEGDALAQFNNQIESVFDSDFNVTILAVTHHFD